MHGYNGQPMTLTTARLLRWLCRRYDAMEPTPSFQAAADHFGVTKGTVQYYARILRREGYLRTDALWPTIAGYNTLARVARQVQPDEDDSDLT